MAVAEKADWYVGVYCTQPPKRMGQIAHASQRTARVRSRGHTRNPRAATSLASRGRTAQLAPFLPPLLFDGGVEWCAAKEAT